MVRSPWPWLVACVVAAACSSSSAKKRVPESADGGDGGDAPGATLAGQGGSDGGASGAVSAGATNEAGAGGAAAESLTDGWLSGSRLRAVLYVSGNARMFSTWHDTMLDIDCSFAIDSDGTQRCLPGYGNGYAAYIDDKCTTPVLVLESTDIAPDIAVEPYQPFEWGKGARYLKVGADVTGVTELFSNSSGTCQPNGTVGATQVTKKLGAAVANSLFVAETETVREPRDERLAANVRVAEDGSRQVVSHYDLMREADCNPRLHTGDGYACIPEDRAYVEYFYSDLKCETPAAYHPAYAQQVCGRAPKIIQESRPGFTDGYYEVGALVSAVFRKDTGCLPYESPGDPDASYYLLGKAVPFSSFPQLSSQNEGSGRTLLQILRGAADELISREDFFDTTLDTACGVGTGSDGKLHCQPRTAYTVNLFDDVGCTQAVLEWSKDAPAPTDFKFVEGNTPAGGTAVWQLGAKIATPAKGYQMNGTECQERAVTDAMDYYDTTTILPSKLPAVTLEQE